MGDTRKLILLTLFITFFGNKLALQLPPEEILVNDGDSLSISLSSYNSTNIAFLRLLKVQENADFIISTTDIPSEVGFVIVQVHTWIFNQSVAYDASQFSAGLKGSISGSNVGLFYPTDSESTVMTTVRNTNSFEVLALAAVVAYTKNDAYPGGCNMIGNIKTAPSQRLSLTNATVTVDADPPSLPKIHTFNDSCNNNLVKTRVYRKFMPEQDFSNQTYFETIAQMLIPSEIIEDSDFIPESVYGTSPFRRIYSSYNGIGSVYGMIAIFANQSSAYVPIVTYACDVSNWESSCQELTTPFSKVLCAIALGVGMFITLHGYNYIKTSMFYCSMIVGSFLCVGFGLYNESSSTTGIVILSLVYGYLVYIIWLRVWMCSTSLIPSLFLSGIVLGSFYFFLFYVSFQVEISYLENDWYFWILLWSFVFLVYLSFILAPVQGTVLCFASVGAFTATLALDYYYGSNLKYILINVIRRFTVPNFNMAIVKPPYQAEDLLLTLVFGGLVVWGMCRQFHVNRSRALYQPSHPTMPHLIRYSNERAPLLHQQRMTDGTRRRYYFYRETTY